MKQINTKLILDKMNELGVSKTHLARVLGISRQAVHYKLKCGSKFKNQELTKICEMFKIPSNKIFKKKGDETNGETNT